MQVSEILAEKGAKVVSVGTDTSILEVAKILTEAKIGAVVVSGGNGEIAGILSERDIVRALGDDGEGTLHKVASDLMSRDVMTCKPGSSTMDVLTQMQSGRLRHLPVVDDSGMSDIVKAVNGELAWMSKVLKEQLVAAAGRATTDESDID